MPLTSYMLQQPCIMQKNAGTSRVSKNHYKPSGICTIEFRVQFALRLYWGLENLIQKKTV